MVKKQNSNSIKLSEPLQAGDNLITEITLREPKFGDLDGIPLDQMNDPKYLRVVLSRISGVEIAFLKDLTMRDSIKLFEGLSNFFQSSTNQEE